MNNKGFAITTILYGTLILFLMLLLSMLSILSTYKDRLDILIESNNGARDIINGVNRVITYGDVDLDGDVDAYDLTKLTRYVNGLEDLNQYALNNADVNADGVVDDTDESLLGSFIGGISCLTLPYSPCK